MISFLRILSFLILSLPFLYTISVHSQATAYPNGMAATAHPLATDAAMEMLLMGGNAVDAAVAAAFAIGVVEPDGSGIGGGGGMVIYLNGQKESYYINYYARAPGQGSKAGYSGLKDVLSGKSVCIPGTVAGLILAHEKFGSLSLETVMAPAIRLASDGFMVDGVLARILLDNIETILSDETTRGIFTSDGFPYMEGDFIVQEELAETLRTISREGRKGFYEGPLAGSMVKGLQERGGTQTLDDFAAYEAILTEPLEGTYRGYEVLTAMPPQSGLSLVEALNMLECYPIGEHPHYSESAEVLHIISEIERYVYADLFEYLGDPTMISIPLTGLTSKEYARARFERINQEKLDPFPYDSIEPGDPYPFMDITYSPTGKEVITMCHPEMAWETTATCEPGGDGGHTTHLSVIDKEGNCVSLTQTLGFFFGSGQTINGVLLNNAMTNFSYYSPDNPNLYADGKTPRSSIMPAILLKDSSPFLVIGSPGAARILSAVIEVLVNIVDYEMDVEKANLAPRFYSRHSEDHLHLESGILPEVQAKLTEMGHSLNVYKGIDLFFGGVQLIFVDPDNALYYGSADKRRGGSVEGF